MRITEIENKIGRRLALAAFLFWAVPALYITFGGVLLINKCAKLTGHTGLYDPSLAEEISYEFVVFWTSVADVWAWSDKQREMMKIADKWIED